MVVQLGVAILVVGQLATAVAAAAGSVAYRLSNTPNYVVFRRCWYVQCSIQHDLSVGRSSYTQKKWGSLAVLLVLKALTRKLFNAGQ